MGSVWLSRLTGAAGFEKLCIVKTVLPSIAKDADFVSRFLHEGRVLTQLSHGNIAQVLDMNEADGQLFIALEYIAGVDLSRLHEQVRAAKEFMPLPLVVALITQAAEGLGAAHRKAALDGSPLNIVHRDVSPHNIMVSYEGEVKVIDFGIAKSEARSRHTAQASVMGKLGYMAPEQARGEALDHRADQYALSIVAWELLANQSWVRRGTLTEMVVAMAHPPPFRPLGPLRPDVPPSLEAVILKALSPLPAPRYATTDEFAQVLMGELLKLGAPPTKPQLGQYVRSRCSSDFATQRQLLTRVSTQRSPPPQSERPKADMLAETLVRPGELTSRSAGDSMLTAPRKLPAAHGEDLATSTWGTDAAANSAVTEAVGLPFTSPARPSVLVPPSAMPRPVAEEPGRPTAADGETSPARPAALARAEAVRVLDDQAAADARPGVRTDLPAVPARAEAPLTSSELAAASPKRSPMIAALAVIGSLGIAAAVSFAFRPPPASELTIDAGAVVVKAPESVPTAPLDAGLPASEFDAGAFPVPFPGRDFPPVEQPTLQLTGRFERKTWSITNHDRRNWTRCRMTLPGQRVIEIGTVPRNASLDLPVNRFAHDAKARLLDGHARVDCSQGFGLIDLSPGR